MDQMAALRALCRVVELGGFTAAAKAIGISHTIVSRQIRQLETRLGTQLLNRSTRRFVLTAAGKEYYEACRDILDALDTAEHAVTQHQARPTGTLRISAPMAFGALELAAWLPQFMLLYPELNIDLVCNDRHVDLIEEGFDVALRIAPSLPDSTLIAKRLAISQAVLVAAPAYLAHGKILQVPLDLLQHNCLIYTQQAKPRDWCFNASDGEAKMQTQTVTVSGNFQANTSIALRAAALGALGIALLPSFIVQEDLRRGDLVHVLQEHSMQARDLYALYPQNRHLAPKVRTLIDFATEIYRNRNWI